MPWVNRLVDAVRETTGLEHGVALPAWDALATGGYPDLAALADAAAQGKVQFRIPAGADATAGAGGRIRRAGPRIRPDRREPRPPAGTDRGDVRAPAALDLPHRRHRRHLRGHPAGTGGRPRGRRRHRRDPVHGPVAAGLRARGRHPRRVRRHVRDARELPADARRARRDIQGTRPVRAADELRLGALHAGDRVAGRPGAAGHDAERLHVRHHLPRYQSPPDVHRPALLAADPRPGRHHHQHRRGQLPDHRGRRRCRAHRRGQPADERVLRQGGGPGRRPARPGTRIRDQPVRAGLVPAGTRARAAGPGAVPGRAAEVHAADQAHDRQRLRRVPAGRLLQPLRAS